jgi:hypothetical protein
LSNYQRKFESEQDLDENSASSNAGHEEDIQAVCNQIKQLGDNAGNLGTRLFVAKTFFADSKVDGAIFYVQRRSGCCARQTRRAHTVMCFTVSSA